ncbi:MAG: hypothetical protein ABI665_13145 [Vicinamibacterales bacterium]
MIEHDRLARLLRDAVPPSTAQAPSRDLWPAVTSRGHSPVSWTWFDLGMAAAVVIVLSAFPDWLWLLAYHL